jgi:hypothetical protein
MSICWGCGKVKKVKYCLQLHRIDESIRNVGVWCSDECFIKYWNDTHGVGVQLAELMQQVG